MTAATATRPNILGWVLFLLACAAVVLAIVGPGGPWRLEELRYPPYDWRLVGRYETRKDCLADAQRHRIVTKRKTRCRRG